MKKHIIVIFNLLFGILTVFSQSEVWSGELDVQGVKLPLVFHLDKDNPTMDSPSQSASGIPIQVTRVSFDTISINIPVIGASFVGKCNNDEIIGTFSQRGFELPLNLRPGEKKIIRPQTPEPPFPYSQEEVEFANGEAVLKGTLTLPENFNEDTPVVIMITGSGLQNRDEEIFTHKPFAVIADALARNGIASLRYDDRGFGESTGDVLNCTTEDLKNDALAGIGLLRQKFKKVGALGHSEGGTISLMLGADKNVDFIVSLAGMIVSGKETLMEQNRWMLSQAGYPQHVVDEYCRLLALAFEGNDSVSEILESAALPEELKQNLQAGFSQLKTPYMQYFLALDIRNLLGDILCPVLALNGTKDTQVFFKNNLEALNKGLPYAKTNKIMSCEGLNHLFQHCMTGSVNEYAGIEETFSTDALDLICQWINSLEKN